jgi:secreted PhoX family phosphatase
MHQGPSIRKERSSSRKTLTAVTSLLFCFASLSASAESYNWTTIAGSPLQYGTADGTNTDSRFNYPRGLTTDNAGTVYIADRRNDLIRRVRHLGNDWVTDTIAGGNIYTHDGTNRESNFIIPSNIAMDPQGRLFVADHGCMRLITQQNTNWIVTTLAGLPYFSGEGSSDGTNGNAKFSGPYGIAFDNAGNVFISDASNSNIRKMRQDGTNWIVTTIAGLAGATGFSDGTNLDARFNTPYGLTADSAGNLFVADGQNAAIRKISPIGTNWVTTTIAGQANSPGHVDGIGQDARFYIPSGITIDRAGNLFVVESSNATIRKLSPAGTNWVVTTIGGTAGVLGFKDGLGTNTQFYPFGIVAEPNGNLFIADIANFAIRYGQLAALLRLDVSQNQAVLSWPLSASNYVLETSAELSADATWSPLTNGVSLSGETFTRTSQTDATPAFFRLHKN